jgi:hypothetical protein
MGKWDSIHYLVKAVCNSDEHMSGSLGIQSWLAGFNRSFVSPTTEQLAQLNNALEECCELLDEETQEQLRFSTRGFS